MFDPADPTTYRVARPCRNRRVIILAMYLLPLVVSMLFWVLQDSSRWAGGARPLQVRLLIGVWQATGPVAWFLMSRRMELSGILIPFGLIWFGWLTHVLTSSLREWPYAVHLAASCLWCFAGCVPTGLVIT